MSLGTPRLAARGSSGRLARPLKRFSTATPLAQHRTGAMNWTVKPITRRTLLFGLTPLAAGAMVIGGMGRSVWIPPESGFLVLVARRRLSKPVCSCVAIAVLSP